MKESPFAPLEAWLRDAVSVQVLRWSGDPTNELDLRDLQTRAAVLRAMHDLDEQWKRDHPNEPRAPLCKPWALGAPWSPLTDEQAGRATAAILRAVGNDPSKPKGVVPLMILGEWEQPTNNSAGRSIVLTLDREYGGDEPAWPLMVTARGWLVQGGPAKANVDFDRFDILAHGPETGEPGRIAADSAARALGCIMIEDITP